MRFRFLFIGLLLMLLAPAALAQQPDQPVPIPPSPLSAESVEIQTTDDGALLIVSGVQTDGCDVPVNADTQIDPAVLYVDLEREPLPPDTFCAMVLQPFSVEIEISSEALIAAQAAQAQAVPDPEATPELTPEITPEVEAQAAAVLLSTLSYIVINDVAFPVNAALAAEDAPLLPLPYEVYPVFVEMAAPFFDEDSEQFAVQVAGTHATGCEGETFVRQQVDEDARVIEVSLYRIVLPAEACPAVLIMVDEAYPLEGEFSGVYEVVVNAFSLTYDFDRREIVRGDILGASPSRVMTVIETVEPLIMESFPVQVTLEVSGYHPDGCRFPVVTEVARDGNNISVEIFREVPADVMCTMQIVPYSDAIELGSLEPGTYTITVNEQTIEITV